MGIRIDSLAVAYDGHRVIDGLSLTIERGSFFTLLGPSGCGKTTLLRTHRRLRAPSAGASSSAATTSRSVPATERDIGMVFQDYALFPDKTVFDNVAYGLRARGRTRSAPSQRKVGQALERVGLQALASATRRRCRAASGSAWRWRARWSSSRRCC
jgi:iron(III) transport system ATP-binding protein